MPSQHGDQLSTKAFHPLFISILIYSVKKAGVPSMNNNFKYPLPEKATNRKFFTFFTYLHSQFLTQQHSWDYYLQWL